MNLINRSFRDYYSEKKNVCHVSFVAMKAQMELLACPISKQKAKRLNSCFYNEALRIEALLNRFDTQSPVSYLNHNAAKNPVRVDNELFAIILTCKQLNALTLGYFDICINSLSMQEPGMDCLVLNETFQSVYFTNEHVQLDFGGIAKGYLLDKISELLNNEQVGNALVNLGHSSILAKGMHPLGNCWKIELFNDNYSNAASHTFELRNECLTTSGMHHNKSPHIISPISGETCTNNCSISVITESGIMGEALSTSLVAACDFKKQKLILANIPSRNALEINYTASIPEISVLSETNF